MLKQTRLAFFAVVGLTLLMTAGGCSDNKNVTASDIRHHMSPELQSIAHTKEQRKNREARTMDTDLRQVWDDFDTLLLLDRPVRLSRYPIP
jgi:hypothetical protein